MSYLVLTYDPSKYLIRVFFMIDMNRACTTLDCKVWVRGPNPEYDVGLVKDCMGTNLPCQIHDSISHSFILKAKHHDWVCDESECNSTDVGRNSHSRDK